MGFLTIILLFLTGIVAGIFGGLLGIGGGAIMLPMTRFAFSFSPSIAVGTTLVAVIFTAVAGTYQHWKMGNVDWKSVRYIAPAGVVGVIIGSILFYLIKDYHELIDLILGIVFTPIAASMIYEGLFLREKPDPPGKTMGGNIPLKAGIGGGVGIFTGMSGLGGGFIMVPAFVYFLRSPVKVAIGSSMASFVWFALVGGIIKISQGLCDVPAAFAMGFGAVGGALIGARLCSRIRPATLKTIFGFIFLYVSLKYILSYFGVNI
ncbi:MAG: sulfite exporter TauE/SafE family protein [Dehalococcoidales bacterium]|nr:sulfite exporter TauE/SafE family protein [Dehalococcoidales bacterium]